MAPRHVPCSLPNAALETPPKKTLPVESQEVQPSITEVHLVDDEGKEIPAKEVKFNTLAARQETHQRTVFGEKQSEKEAEEGRRLDERALAEAQRASARTASITVDVELFPYRLSEEYRHCEMELIKANALHAVASLRYKEWERERSPRTRELRRSTEALADAHRRLNHLAQRVNDVSRPAIRSVM